MGYWKTKNGNQYNVNIHVDLIKAMQNKGARFCFMDDTPGITDKEDETFYETKQEDETTTETTTETANDTYRVLRHDITVVTENGDKITGYVAHWVRNYNNRTSGTDIQNWFIFQPGTYPTRYIIERPDHANYEMIVTDL